MVSFSCESCGDVLTKKKLDSHRGQCRNASFTCLDCMTHFRGTEYKAHTSCISEAQKYQGALFKEKPAKGKKQVSISNSTSLVPRKAYVEDAVDIDLDNQVAIVEAPPHAPSPPRPAPAQPVNVFDFLVTDETPNASKISLGPNASMISLGGSHEPMQMVDHAPSLFNSTRSSIHEFEDALEEPDLTYEETGYTYGADPIPTIEPTTYQTPAPKGHNRHKSELSMYELDASSTRKSTDKKRKRQVEDLDLTQARRSSQELDEIMLDAHDPDSNSPAVLHSGLTGGLNRLLSKHKFPPSPEYSGGSGPSPNNPLSPVKRSKSVATTHTTTAVEHHAKSRGRSSALVKIRKVRRTSDESRPRKHHRSHRNAPDDTHRHASGDSHHHSHHRAPSERPKRALKTIEYNPSHNGEADTADNGGQIVVYRTRAELFLSFVTKGPESESGCSVNKALKRYHRERGEQGLGLGKGEEEKELWKGLRLRRNERGEVVLIC